MPLHPIMSALLERSAGAPAISSGSPEDARRNMAVARGALGTGPELHAVIPVTIPTRGGFVQGRYFLPSQSPSGLVLYLHGGGWVIGGLDDFDAYCRALASETGYGVLLLDYRLAPEHPFPAAVEDCQDTLAACLGGSIEGVLSFVPLIIAGDSAGGNLAAVTVRTCSMRKQIAGQILSYPVTDCDFATQSYSNHGVGLPLGASDMQWFFGHYASHNQWALPDISILRADVPTDTPPTTIISAEYDVLRDEGEAYAEKLATAGVMVRSWRVEGVTHGYIRLFNIFEIARTELQKVSAEVKRLGSLPRQLTALTDPALRDSRAGGDAR